MAISVVLYNQKHAIIYQLDGGSHPIAHNQRAVCQEQAARSQQQTATTKYQPASSDRPPLDAQQPAASNNPAMDNRHSITISEPPRSSGTIPQIQPNEKQRVHCQNTEIGTRLFYAPSTFVHLSHKRYRRRNPKTPCQGCLAQAINEQNGQSKPRQTAQASTHMPSVHMPAAWSQHISLQAELNQGRKPSTDIIEASSEQTSCCRAVAHHVAFLSAHDKSRKREHFLGPLKHLLHTSELPCQKLRVASWCGIGD